MRFSATFFLFLILATSVNLRAQTKTQPAAETEDEVVRVSTNLVVVPAVVKTRQGEYVANLRREDFRVYEDGVEQEIAYFEGGEKPFNVTLMLDVSDSTQARLAEIQNAAVAFLNQLRPDDRALVVAFDKRLVRLTEMTGDRKVLSDAIRRVKTGGGTALYDAVEAVIKAHRSKGSRREAVVILSDGMDTSSVRATYESTVNLASEQYALIYPIQWDTSGDTQAARASGMAVYVPGGQPPRVAYERGSRYLQFLARNSGGRFHYADSIKHLERAFSQIAEDLRQQYSMGYYPSSRAAKKEKRRIRITVGVPGAVVQARDSYTYLPDAR